MGREAAQSRPSPCPCHPPKGPPGVDFTAVLGNLLLSVEGVEALHSLHIWALTVAQPILSVHMRHPVSGESTRARETAGIRGHPCPTCPDDAGCSWCERFGSDPMLSTGHLLFI